LFHLETGLAWKEGSGQEKGLKKWYAPQLTIGGLESASQRGLGGLPLVIRFDTILASKSSFWRQNFRELCPQSGTALYIDSRTVPPQKVVRLWSCLKSGLAQPNGPKVGTVGWTKKA